MAQAVLTVVGPRHDPEQLGLEGVVERHRGVGFARTAAASGHARAATQLAARCLFIAAPAAPGELRVFCATMM